MHLEFSADGQNRRLQSETRAGKSFNSVLKGPHSKATRLYARIGGENSKQKLRNPISSGAMQRNGKIALKPSLPKQCEHYSIAKQCWIGCLETEFSSGKGS
jgi:hypothetical protein